jgi:hypothetical protein
MNSSQLSGTDPRLLLEAARVFNAAGPDYANAAGVVAEQALKALQALKPETIDPGVHQAIIADVAALRLSGRLPGGYDATLELLNEIQDDSSGRLHLLRALANGQKYRATRAAGKSKDDPEPVMLREQIRQDLETAFARNPRLKVANRHFWQPAAATLGPGAAREDDLWFVYEDDPEFQKLVSLTVGGATETGAAATRGTASANRVSPAAAERPQSPATETGDR